MPTQRHINSFEKGMRSDEHPTMQPAGTYTYAEGFTLRFAAGGGMVLSVEQPAEFITLLPAGSRLRGGGRLPDGRILLLLNLGGTNASPGPVHSTIAILDGSVVTTIYDDLFDPNDERLKLSDTEPATVTIETETVSITRVYINESTQTPYCVNLGDAPAPGFVYGKLWSVHAFRLQPHVQFDPIYFFSVQPGGSLPTGFYRYTYRYYRRGIVSTPFPLSTPLPLGENAATAQVQLGASGVTTTTGLVFKIDRPDRRWPQVELLVSYSPDGSAWTNLVVADRQDTPTFGNPILLTHTRPAGIGLSVALDELSASGQVSHLLTAQAMAVKNNKLIFGGITLSPSLKPTVTKATLSVQVESMACDDGGYPNAPVNGVAMASTNADNTPILERLFQPKVGDAVVTRSFPVDGAMRDYRSMQYSNRRVGLRRGERYAYAAVLFDLLGQPGFAWHLGVLDVPPYYANATGNDIPYAPVQTITIGDQKTYRLRIVGCNVSGIELPESLLFDESGKLKVSGIAIVRGPASGRIQHQGIILPAVTAVNDGKILSPLPSFRNYFADQPINGRLVLSGDRTQDGFALYHLPGWVTYHCPDLLIDGKIDEQPVAGSQLRLLGSAHGPANGRQGTTVLRGEKDHYYVKAYDFRVDNFRPDAPGRWKVGDSSPIKYSFRVASAEDMEKFYAPNQELKFRDRVAIRFANPNGSGAADKFGINQVGSFLFQLTGSSLADRGVDEQNPSGYGIVNFEQPVAELNPLAATYQWTNHFQPITQAILDQLPVSGAAGSRVWRLDNVDVWGGDTFLCRTDMARVAPQYKPDFGDDSDYAVGLFLPIESRYNLYLRYGRRYEKVATMPQVTARDGSYPEFRNGVNEFQPEEWFLNRGLRVQETVRFFAPPPPDVQLESAWPAGVIWSRLKTDGELLDNYRRFPALNLYLLEGEHGPVRGLFTLFDRLYAGQDRAISYIPVDQRQLVATTEGQPLEAATGRELGPAEYLARQAGFSRRQHAWVSPRSIYFLDQVARKFFRFSQAGIDPISDRDGYHTRLLDEDMADWSGHFDSIDDTVHILSPLGRLTYNEVLNAFVSTHGQPGPIWVDGRVRPLQVEPSQSSLSYPGRIDANATLSFVVNPAPTSEKTFHAMVITCSQALAAKLISAGIQADDSPVDSISASQMRWRSGRLYLPLRSNNRPLPQRGKSLQVTLLWEGLTKTEEYWLLSVSTDYSLTLRP